MKDIKNFFNERAENWDKVVFHNSGRIKDILSLFNIEKNCKILDLGCGTGILESYLLKYSNDITAVDFSENMIEKAREKFPEGIKFLCLDLFEVEGKFDLIFLYSIYPHIFDKEKLAKKLYEILNDNGRFIIFHSEGRNTINNMHNIKAKDLSIKIEPAVKEKECFEKLFNVDNMIDNENCFLLSGVKQKV